MIIGTTKIPVRMESDDIQLTRAMGLRQLRSELRHRSQQCKVQTPEGWSPVLSIQRKDSIWWYRRARLCVGVEEDFYVTDRATETVHSAGVSVVEDGSFILGIGEFVSPTELPWDFPDIDGISFIKVCEWMDRYSKSLIDVYSMELENGSKLVRSDSGLWLPVTESTGNFDPIQPGIMLVSSAPS